MHNSFSQYKQESPITNKPNLSIGIHALVRLVTVDRANLEASKAAFDSEHGVVILFKGVTCGLDRAKWIYPDRTIL